jgi:thioredoxin reductase (NADPH)
MGQTELTAVHGVDRLEQADLRNRVDGKTERVEVSAVFVMIGAEPRTDAVRTVLDLDEAGYIRCGDGAASRVGANGSWSNGRQPFLLETVWPGVFAAGDVRAGGTKRVAAAVGDGALAVRFAYELLSASAGWPPQDAAR